MAYHPNIESKSDGLLIGSSFFAHHNKNLPDTIQEIDRLMKVLLHRNKRYGNDLGGRQNRSDQEFRTQRAMQSITYWIYRVGKFYSPNWRVKVVKDPSPLPVISLCKGIITQDHPKHFIVIVHIFNELDRRHGIRRKCLRILQCSSSFLESRSAPMPNIDGTQ